MTSYPIYLLQLGDEIRIVFPEGKEDLGHTDFWERTVSFIVAGHYGIPQRKLANLPYCQKRGRIVGDKFLYGERTEAGLLELIRKAVGEERLVLCFDEHERRLKEDVRQFQRLIGKNLS